MSSSSDWHSEAMPRGSAERSRYGTFPFMVASFVVVCVTISFFPIGEPADPGSSALNASRIIELGLLGAAAGVITLAILFQRCDLTLLSPAAALAFLFCAWAAASALWSTAPVLSMARGVMLLLLLYIAVGLAIYVRHNFADRVRAISMIMVAGIFGGIAALCLINLAMTGALVNFTESSSWSGRQGRLYFVQSQPLESGELISVAMTLVAFAIRSIGLKLLLLAPLFLLLELTHSRNLIVFVPLALAAATFQCGSIRLRVLMVAAAVCGLGYVVVFAFSGHLAAALPQDLADLNGRMSVWRISADVIGDKPWLGVGFYASRFYLLDADFDAGHAHNSYIEAALATGLIGLALLLWFFGYCVKTALSADNGLLTAMVTLIALGSIFNPLILGSTPHTFYLFLTCIIFAEVAVLRQAASAPEPIPVSGHVALRQGM